MKNRVVMVELTYAGGMQKVEIARDRQVEDTFGHNIFKLAYAVNTELRRSRLIRAFNHLDYETVGITAVVNVAPRQILTPEKVAYEKWLKEAG